MEVQSCLIVNPKPFIDELFRFVKDRNKLPFKNYTFNLEECSDTFLEQLEKLENYANRSNFNLLIVPKENSLIDEDIYFPFSISTTRKNRNKKKIERIRIRFLG